jgi:hypothetical protein
MGNIDFQNGFALGLTANGTGNGECSCEVLQVINTSTDNPPQAVYSANVINEVISQFSGIIEITKDTYITELESGIYRCKLENGVCLFLDTDCAYGLVDGIAIVYKLSGSALYNFLMLGIDTAWFEHTMVGTYDSDTDTVTIKDLTSVLNAEDVLQSINQSTNNPPQAVYSANVINENIVIPTSEHITELYSASRRLNSLISLKEDKSNKATEIEADNTDEQYASAKAVYDFGVKIIAEVEEMLENFNGGSSKMIDYATNVGTETPNVTASVSLEVKESV